MRPVCYLWLARSQQYVYIRLMNLRKLNEPLKKDILHLWCKRDPSGGTHCTEDFKGVVLVLRTHFKSQIQEQTNYFISLKRQFDSCTSTSPHQQNSINFFQESYFNTRTCLPQSSIYLHRFCIENVLSQNRQEILSHILTQFLECSTTVPNTGRHTFKWLRELPF